MGFENSRDEKAVTKVINLLQTSVEGIKSDVKDAGADYKLGEATQDALETLKAISKRINTKREKREKRANKIIKKYTQKKKEMQLLKEKKYEEYNKGKEVNKETLLNTLDKL